MNESTRRIAAGYNNHAENKRRARLAAAFRIDARLERLLELKKKDPTSYGRLSAVTRIAVGLYGEQKLAFQEEVKSDD